MSHPQQLPPGGDVLGIAAGPDGTCWLAAEAGLWRGRPGAWLPLEAQPLPRVDAIALVSGAGERARLLAGGLGLALSLDGGAAWLQPDVDQVAAPVSCFAVAPAQAEQPTVLAGTAGAGVLRSTDGGRSWRLSNAGLEELVVLALAAAPAWGRREEAFALTSGGLYRSPNGGRYWQRVLDCGDDRPLQALAVSPGFAADGTVFAAGEAPGLWRSQDGGRSWAWVAPLAGGPASLSCLLALAGHLLAGTAAGEVWRSHDGGASWRREAALAGPLQALAAHPGGLLAAALGGGLAGAGPQGDAWRPEAGLALRDITRLALAADGAALAYGPRGGLWRHEPAGWRQLLAGDPAEPLACLLPLGSGSLLAGTPAHLIVCAPSGGRSASGLPGAAATALLQQPDGLWLGDADGRVWRRRPGAPSWDLAADLAPAGPVVALAPAQGGPLIATWAGPARRARVWRSNPAGRWAPWLEAPSDGARISLCPGDPHLVACGKAVFRRGSADWESSAPDGRPVAALIGDPAGQGWLAATAGGVYRSPDGAAWQRIEADLPPGGPIDLLALPDGGLLALGRGGALARL